MTCTQERRKAPRYSCHGPIDFRIPGWHSRKGRILNLCLSGCLIRPALNTNGSYEIGDQLDLRFEVNRFRFRVQCAIRSIHPSGSLGVEILGLSERCRGQLYELVSELATISANPCQLLQAR